MKVINGKNIKNRLPRVAAIHDLSCFGRCALTVVIPTLSAMGVQVVPIPTALLSTHTGGFTNMYFEDLTDRMEEISWHLDSLNVKFDAIYTGFLASERQISVVSEFIDRFADEDCLVFVDPVMGDDGELYSTYTRELAEGMKRLCERADIITPNLTEACILADVVYDTDKSRSFDGACSFAESLCARIGRFTSAKIVITGLHYGGGFVGSYVCDGDKKALFGGAHIDANYPGTGDLFASVLLGRILQGEPLSMAAKEASGFTRDTVDYSLQFPTPVREGVALEGMLQNLIKKQEK